MACALSGTARAEPDADPLRELHSLRNISDQLRGTAGIVLHRLEVSPPPPKGASSGLLSVEYWDIFADERGGPGVVLVTVAGKTTRVSGARRTKRSFVVPAGAELQRWRLDGRDLFIHVRPKEEIVFVADACARWALSSERLSSPMASDALSVCRASDAPCPSGFAESADAPNVRDRRCRQLRGGSDKTKICVRMGSLTVRARVPAMVHSYDESGGDFDETVTIAPDRHVPPIPLRYERCSRPMIEIGTHRALLVIGFGEDWTLDVDANGEIRGRVGP